MIPDPHEVFIEQNGVKTKVLGYACAECSILHPARIYCVSPEEALKTAYDSAKHCCHRLCTDCGVDMFESGRTNYCGSYTACPTCRAKHESEHEKNRFEKAEKVSLQEYNQEVFHFCDEFFYDYEELLSHVQDAYDIEDMVSGNLPPVYGVVPFAFHVDASDVIENALSDHHEDANEEISQKDVDRLQRMLDKWCSDMNIVSYDVNFHTVVVMPQNWWMDGLLCAHDGCGNQAVVWGDDDSLCCHFLDHRKEEVTYKPLVGEGK